MVFLCSRKIESDPQDPPDGGVPVTWRRRIFAALVGATVLVATALMIWTLSAGGFDGVDGLLTLCFLITLPWTAIGFWNAVVGLILMRASANPVTAVCPVLSDSRDRSEIATSTAILSCIRNEDIGTVTRNLDRMLGELADAGALGRFHLYVLSDSHWPEYIAAEESALARLRERWRGLARITYRRRPDNPGYKAGNIRDFCARWGERHDFALVLDADSLMSANTILRLVRTLQAHPRLGILQTLVVGLPTTSPFARPFQFGMRLGMRGYSIGSAWWQADAGPYWGHNALIRLRPFIAHCMLERLPGSGPLAGWVLSHDQVEAALMRRAGYAVRVMPQEGGSWEENPPTLTEFLRRDLRWCQGNMQYLKLLGTPGLHAVSRVQLWLAILMFIASPAWVMLMGVGVLRASLGDAGPIYDPAPGLTLFVLVMLMVFAPKLATLIDTLATPALRRGFGGTPRLLLGSLAEAVFSTLLAPVMAIAHSIFIGGLVFGRTVVWGAQRRVVHRVRVCEALRRLWPQTLVGIGGLGWLALSGAAGAMLFSPFLLGALLAVPIAVLSSIPALGQRLTEIGLWRIPEETESASPDAGGAGAQSPDRPQRVPALPELGGAAIETAD